MNRLGQSKAAPLQHDMETYRKRAAAFGFNAIVVDGHDVEELCKVGPTGWDGGRGWQRAGAKGRSGNKGLCRGWMMKPECGEEGRRPRDENIASGSVELAHSLRFAWTLTYSLLMAFAKKGCVDEQSETKLIGSCR